MGIWWLKYAIIGVALLAVAIWIGALKAEVNHYRTKAVELQLWKDEAIAAGKKADEDNRKKEQAYAEQVKQANAAAATANARLAGWMRQHKPGSSLPAQTAAAPAGTDRTGQICFDRAQLDAAIGRFRADVAAIVADGQQAVIDRQECVAGWPQ